MIIPAIIITKNGHIFVSPIINIRNQFHPVLRA
jgi:hypothetical protein